MTVHTYAPWAAGLLLAASAAFGLAATTPGPTVPAEPARAVPKALPQGPNKIVFCRGVELTRIDPDGKNPEPVLKADAHLDSEDYCLSPDGKRVAVVAAAKTVRVMELGKAGRGTDVGPGGRVFWSGDGTELLVAAPAERAYHLVNPATGARTEVKLPASHTLSDWSRDGKFFLTAEAVAREGGKGTARRHVVLNRDGSEHAVLAEDKHQWGAGCFSPDGKRVLFLDGPTQNKLTIVEVATGKATPVGGIPAAADQVFAYCWGPDGKRIAYTWRTTPAGGEGESSLVVCDPAGTNAATVAGGATGETAVGGVHWR